MLLSVFFLNVLKDIPQPNSFWRMVWIMLIAFLLTIGTMYVYFKLRASTFRRVRKMLQERVTVKTKQLAEKNTELEKLSIVASKTDNAVLIASADTTIEWCNDAFARMALNASIEENIIGKTIGDLNLYSSIQEKIQESVAEKKSKLFESQLNFNDGLVHWINSTLTPIYDESGTLKKFVLVDTDITSAKMMQDQIKSSLKEKDVLLKEIHHRVKNNLQIIISLLNLQSDYIKDEQTLKAVTDGQNRVRSMALVHEKFYQSEELSEIDFNDYAGKLLRFLVQSYGSDKHPVVTSITGDTVSLDMDTAMPCGLLLNEIISNSYKYAFIDGREGKIEINFQKTGANIISMRISDNGVGFPADFSIDKSETLGMQLINALTSQIDGEVKLESNQGASFTITFSYPKS